MRGDNLAIADQVRAVLREAGEPMTAAQIASRVGCVLQFSCSGERCCADPSCSRGPELDLIWAEHHDGYDVVARDHISGDWASRVMQKTDGVARRKIGRRVYWEWAGESPDMAEFEQALEAQR